MVSVCSQDKRDITIKISDPSINDQEGRYVISQQGFKHTENKHMKKRIKKWEYD